MKQTYKGGALESPKDIRNITYSSPITYKQSGGKRWLMKDIDDQKQVGICTAISLTMKASKDLGVKFSPEFQYLCQKTVYDNNWDEGSSILHSLKVGKNIGFLPKTYMDKWVTEEDRKLPYQEYIKKLQAIPKDQVEYFKTVAFKYRLSAYATVPVERNAMANSIVNSNSGILSRFVVGKEWWTNPIEPLRPPKQAISGHAVNQSNFNGRSFRIPNSWGIDWADKGSAYYLINQYQPTECWQVWYNDSAVPEEVTKILRKRKTLIGRVINIFHKIYNKLNKWEI